MVRKVNTNYQWLKAFDNVTYACREFLSVQGPSVGGFYKSLEKIGNRGTRNPTKILPTVEDYLADVLSAVRAVIPAEQRREFAKAFIGNEDDVNKELVDRKTMVRLGQIFVARGLFPVKAYFYSKESCLDISCSCGNKAHVSAKGSAGWCLGGCGLNVLYHEVGMVDQDPVKHTTRFWCLECAKKDEERLINQCQEKKTQKKQ